MTKKIVIIGLGLLVFSGSVVAANPVRTKAIPIHPVYLNGTEPLPAVAPYYPGTPHAICIGDTIGYTQYEYQTNGSTGRRMVIDSEGGMHFAWMWSDHYGVTRNVRYNCFGSYLPSPWPVEGEGIGRAGSGYCQIGISSGGRAVIAYHNMVTGAESLYTAKDVFQCQGTFFTGRPPGRMGSNKSGWPYISVDRSDRIHLVATTSATNMPYSYMLIGYTRSNNGGSTWTAMVPVDTCRTISAIVVSSKVSDKVAIIYCHPYSIDSTGGRNDVYYIQSTDGISWNWATDKINLTNYHLNNDSLFAWNEVSAVYDYEDNLHIVWPAQYVSGGIDTLPYFHYGRAHIYHWASNTNIISGFASFDTVWPQEGCDMGASNFVYSKVSCAVDPFPSQHVWVAYTSWDSTDCSAGGFANGDIYLQESNDNGLTWEPKLNLTDSQTPGCLPGDCDSDNWSSLAEYTNGDALHLFYINDKDAGAVVQTEGVVTDNLVLYLAYPVTSVDGDIPQPKNFSLAQNYPNPFNTRTNIDFELAKGSMVNLSVYDITGAKVSTLVNSRLDGGKHQVNWDANGIASGVYFYTLKTNEAEVTKQMTLLK